MKKTAIIVGSAGQDGYYLTNQLIDRGYNVVGVERDRIANAPSGLGSENPIFDQKIADRLVDASQPAEIYYLAAHHRSSEDESENAVLGFERSFDVHVKGLLHFLEGIRKHCSTAKLFYAASSHVFGNPRNVPQTEETPFDPVSVYGITKASGVEICRMYRRDHDLSCSSGILYNHESSRRGPAFIGQKIVKGAVAIKRGQSDSLVLGDLEAAIDWGDATDYAQAMQAILSIDEAGEFVIATGETHTVDEFVDIVFGILDLSAKRYVSEDPNLLNKAERSRQLVGDATKLKRLTDWRPSKNFQDIVRDLVEAELAVET